MATRISTLWNATTDTQNSGAMLHRCITVEVALLQLCVMDIFMLWEATGHLI